MPIELHIQTIVGRTDKEEEPSTAYKLDCDDFTYRELNQFYMYLRYCLRQVEAIIDEDIEEDE